MACLPNLIALNNALVDQLRAKGAISSPCVEAAFRAVPRHLFVPDAPLDKVYRDEVIVTKESPSGQAISSCSQPAIVAVMLEQLGAEPGQNVLEIGAGTGHAAALIAQLVGDTGQVTTIDIQCDLVERAREHLQAAGFPQVQVICADGGLGYAPAAPYDRIILTAASSDIAPAWREQLKPGGRLLLPLSLLPGIQQSIAFEKTEACLTSVSLRACGFMPLQGKYAAERMNEVELSSERGLIFILDHGGLVDAEATYRLLRGESRDLGTDLSVSVPELWSLGPWVTFHEPNACSMMARGDWLNRGIVPYLVGVANQWGNTGGLIEGAVRLALHARPPGASLPAEFQPDEPPFRLHVRSYGPDDALAERLIEQTRAWDRAGRPTFESAQVKACPLESEYTPSAGEYLLLRPSTRLVLRWEI